MLDERARLSQPARHVKHSPAAQGELGREKSCTRLGGIGLREKRVSAPERECVRERKGWQEEPGQSNTGANVR